MNCVELYKAGQWVETPIGQKNFRKRIVVWAKIADNLIDRDFGTTAPLEKWTTDVSQFNLSWG